MGSLEIIEQIGSRTVLDASLIHLSEGPRFRGNSDIKSLAIYAIGGSPHSIQCQESKLIQMPLILRIFFSVPLSI